LAELRFWSITTNASIPAKPGRSFVIFTVISRVRRKRALFRLFPFSKTERGGCQKWSSSLFLKTLSPSINLKIEEISTNRKRRLSLGEAAKKKKVPTFLNVLPPPHPATQNIWVLVTTFSSSKAHLWLV
jgi:hypothetical protein